MKVHLLIWFIHVLSAGGTLGLLIQKTNYKVSALNPVPARWNPSMGAIYVPSTCKIYSSEFCIWVNSVTLGPIMIMKVVSLKTMWFRLLLSLPWWHESFSAVDEHNLPHSADLLVPKCLVRCSTPPKRPLDFLGAPEVWERFSCLDEKDAGKRKWKSPLPSPGLEI